MAAGNDHWNDDSIQFPRLLAEISALGMNMDDRIALCASMDIDGEELANLFIRAEKAWEKIKREKLPNYTPDEDEDEQWLDIKYKCPFCSHEWEEQGLCACDSECPECGAGSITALSWEEAQEEEEIP